MSDTFTDNQEVTASDLNNIAIDLGYADYSHFPETPPQSAVSALNQITGDLVSAGVLLTGNKCNVTFSDNKIYVATGIIIFDSGAKKRIEEVQSLDVLDGGTNYIYGLNDTANNTIELVCSLTEPTTGDFVKLAEVADGVVTDIRTYPTAAVNLPTLNSYQKIAEIPLRASTNNGTEYELIKTQPTEINNYNFISYGLNNIYGYETSREVLQFTDNTTPVVYIKGADCKFVKSGFNLLIYAIYSSTGSYSVDLKNIILM